VRVFASRACYNAVGKQLQLAHDHPCIDEKERTLTCRYPTEQTAIMFLHCIFIDCCGQQQQMSSLFLQQQQ
jgi:hypothetical protein